MCYAVGVVAQTPVLKISVDASSAHSVLPVQRQPFAAKLQMIATVASKGLWPFSRCRTVISSNLLPCQASPDYDHIV